MTVTKVAALADGGADINAKDRNGNTPLHYAVIGGQENSVKVLVTRKVKRYT
jgi:ankyrin repeat protein